MPSDYQRHEATDFQRGVYFREPFSNFLFYEFPAPQVESEPS